MCCWATQKLKGKRIWFGECLAPVFQDCKLLQPLRKGVEDPEAARRELSRFPCSLCPSFGHCRVAASWLSACLHHSSHLQFLPLHCRSVFGSNGRMCSAATRPHFPLIKTVHSLHHVSIVLCRDAASSFFPCACVSHLCVCAFFFSVFLLAAKLSS